MHRALSPINPGKKGAVPLWEKIIGGKLGTKRTLYSLGSKERPTRLPKRGK